MMKSINMIKDDEMNQHETKCRCVASIYFVATGFNPLANYDKL